MTSKSDWNDAYRDLIAEGRRRIEPPTVEDIEALYRGDLLDEEADRVREQLAYYPDMAAAMNDEQLDADLAAIDAESHAGAASPTVFPRRERSMPALAIAASIVVVLALGGWIYFKMRDQPLSRAILVRVLDADGHKGGPGPRGPGGEQTPIQLSTATDYALKPVFRPRRSYGEYRLELLDLDSSPPRSVWKRDAVQRQPDGSFPAELSTADLEPGLYQLVLYGVDNGSAERLATYTIRFSAP
jgi:hypothetical protein